ncbi:ABC transporter ATP-binding protein [Aminivibrio sp.]|uniref:ABC transporter ATP-binding protein n=1 Tax=Aminivibrio sp. TaxID=1872489 RepID=UPI0025B9FBE4|nr:ABC transporter ATP-binding protein [Aminivibrio sp.]
MIDIRNLSVTYGRITSEGRGSRAAAVKNVSMTIRKGQFSALAGESGSGKSTILMAIPGLLPPGTVVSGEILLDGKDLLTLPEKELNRIRWRRIAIVPQGAMNSFTPVLTVGRHVEEVLSVHLGLSRKEALDRIPSIFALAGLDEELARRYPHELSGGQKQRAAIALALACSPDYLLCDEPTTALDVITQQGIIATLKNLVEKKGLGLLLISHDLPLAASVADRLHILKDGELVEEGDPAEITARPRNPHTRALVKALLDLEEES